jgi:uncharacterized membrane protein
MVLRPILALLLIAALPDGAAAHKEHRKEKTEQASASSSAGATVNHPMSPQVHAAGDLAQLEGEAAKSWTSRLVDWIGRTHPFAVHFPLALFPIAWIALLLGRRRGDTEPLVRSLIVVAGASSAIAGALGWLNGGLVLADPDPLLMWHRWLGTVLGLGGAGVAIWSWRRASAAHSRAMVRVLGVTTLLLLVQGWIGGALVHGIDHMNL